MAPIGQNIYAANVSHGTRTGTAIRKTFTVGAAKPKEKRRNTEKRKEKSRDAARFRRSREAEIFNELAQFLPLEWEHVNQLDKASVMRIAIAYLKVREMLKLFPKMIEFTDFLNRAKASEIVNQTLDGFLIVISNDGDITYVSNNIAEYLGIPKIDIMGQQIWEYSHQCDYEDLREALNIKHTISNDTEADEYLLGEKLLTFHRELLVRLKCTLTNRGRSINIKSASYKVIHITGHLVINKNGDRVLVAIGRPIPHPSNIEIPLGTTTFLTKHRTNMQFTYVDDKMYSLLGYSPKDLTNKSFFDYHHGADSDSLLTTFKTVFNKGQAETGRYRFLGKLGGFCWIFTQATILYDKLKPQSVICVNYVISNLENNDEIYSLAQYEANQQQLEKNTEDISGKSVSKEIEYRKRHQQELKQVDDHSGDVLSSKNKNTTNRNNKQTNDDNVEVKSNIVPTYQKIITAEARAAAKSTEDASLQQFIATDVKSCNILNALRQSTLCSNLQNNCLLKWTDSKEPTAVLLTTAAAATKAGKHPKSVTASVFRAAPPTNKTNNINAKTLNTCRILPVVHDQNSSKESDSVAQFISEYTSQHSPVSCAPPAQLVTASTSLSSLCNKQQQSKSDNKVSRVTVTTINGQKPQQSFSWEPSKDMNKRFLSFSEDATQLHMLKEEHDDLTKLTSVEACMPLAETTPLFGEIIIGLMPYGSLLPDDVNSLESVSYSSPSPVGQLIQDQIRPTDSCNGEYSKDDTNTSRVSSSTSLKTYRVSSSTSLETSSSTCASPKMFPSPSTYNEGIIDPFIIYREESNDTICSQQLLSPNMSSKSPEVSSLPSLCSPNSLSQEDEFAFMTMSMDADIDLSMRAPYIPMNEQEDLPLLTADDLMWGGGSTFSTDELNMQKGNSFQYNALKQQMETQQKTEQFEQQESCTNRTINCYQLQPKQGRQEIINFHDSLCSPTASTCSSLPASPTKTQESSNSHNNHHGGNQQTSSDSVFSAESSEYTALLCDSVNASFPVLSSNSGEEDAPVENCSHDDVDCIIGVKNAICTTQQQAIHNALNERTPTLHQQSLEAEQQLIEFGIECKKANIQKNEASSTEMCNSIEDDLENVYNDKTLSNLDCWNDLIHINDTSSSMSTASANTLTLVSALQPAEQKIVPVEDYSKNESKLNINLEQRNNYANDGTTETARTMPFITLQKKTILLQRLADQRVNNAFLSVNHFANNKKVITINQKKTTTQTPTSIDNKQIISKVTSVAATQQQYSNKRPVSFLWEPSQVNKKRLKNDSNPIASIELQASAHPLQQLMSPMTANVTPSDREIQDEVAGTVTQCWSNMQEIKVETPTTNQTSQQMKQHQSNSVLKNLLISGCDVSEGYLIVPMTRKKLAKA